MKKLLVSLSAMAVVFGMSCMVSADPVELNLSWAPEGGVNFDMTSRSHTWKYVLADYEPDYVVGWKAVSAAIGVHIPEGYTPGKFRISVEGKFEAVLDIRADAGPPAYVIGDYGPPDGFVATDVVTEGIQDGEVEITITILQNDDGTWPAFNIFDMGIRPNMEMTLMIGDCDTRVIDQEYDGKLISEYIDDCASDAETHGEFVFCAADLADTLVNDDVITPLERFFIVWCALISP